MDKEKAGLIVMNQFKHSKDIELNRLGGEMFRMFTEMGFPPDMFLDELAKRRKLTTSQRAFIVHVYCGKLIEHKRLSGAEEKSLDKQRKRNIELVYNVLKGKEMGIY